ncbi:DUF3422 family protein [Marinobacterium sp. YM272]|uniref:DUF3422 family protein n=1 Tax=Marinobacterium sp. YM272 TaxID=3421654 RepID=UPI003D7F81EB
MRTHPLRHQIIGEVHARPFQKLYSPVSLIHVAVTVDDQTHLDRVKREVVKLAQEMGLYDAPLGSFFFCRNELCALRFELHNEFYTLTAYRFGSEDLPSGFLERIQSLDGAFLCGCELVCSGGPEDVDTWVRGQFKHQIAGSEMMGGAARAWTDFHHRDDSGLTRILVEDISLGSYQRGRLLQRLCEIEVYRHMALLGLPEAHRVMPQVSRFDQSLARISSRLSSEPAADLLDELTVLASGVEALAASTANRFAATEAYFALVDSRIDELREARIEGLQTIAQFMERRADPAHRTCRSTGQRIESLSQRIARTSELIRSQVDLSTEQQVRDLLSTLSGRARSQLRLQAKLEGFTVIVVTYYAFDLIERTLRNTIQVDRLLDMALLILGGAVPLIALVLWLYVRRMLRGIEDD